MGNSTRTVSRPTPLPILPRKLPLLGPDAFTNTLDHIRNIRASLPTLDPLLAQHGIIRNELIYLRHALEHTCRSNTHTHTRTPLLGRKHIRTEPSFLHERLVDLPHLVDPAVCLGRHAGQPMLRRRQCARVEFFQMLFQRRENARLMRRRETQNTQRDHTFAEASEARFQRRCRAYGIADNSQIQSVEEVSRQYLRVSRSRYDDRWPFPGIVFA